MAANPDTPWSDPVAADWSVATLNTDVAHPARVYDYLLGGKNNFPADREVAAQLVVVRPELMAAVRANREFLGRAVRYAVARGVRQFLDIGTGIPTEQNTHEVAQALAADSTVAYVDNDPLVLVHSRALMAAEGRGQTGIVQGDLRDPQAILSHPEVRAVIDFDRPVALMLVAILHFIGDSDGPGDIVATLRDALAPGSLIVLSHGTYDEDQLDELARFASAYSKASSDIHVRRPSEVLRFFDGFDMVDPGLVLVSDWHPEPDTVPLPPQAGFRGGVGILSRR